MCKEAAVAYFNALYKQFND